MGVTDRVRAKEGLQTLLLRQLSKNERNKDMRLVRVTAHGRM